MSLYQQPKQNRFVAALKRAAFRFSGIGGGTWGAMDPYAWYMRQLPGSQYDYRREAGLLWENSIVLACINWQVRTMVEAPLAYQKKDADGKWIDAGGHPLLDLLEDPNPWYDASVLWGGTMLSWPVAGNGYWFKNRSAARKPVELIYIPHWHLRPMWNSDGSDFISFYEYKVNGKTYRYDPKDIVHFRSGMDPVNTRLGLADLSAGLREIAGDNETSTFGAALLRNMGIPGVIVSAKEGVEVLTKEQADAMETRWENKFTGDGRGRPLISTMPIDVNIPAFNPEQMLTPKIRLAAEERICALFGVPPPLIGLASDGAGRSTYTNKEQAELEGWRGLKAVLGAMGRQLTKQLLPDFEMDTKGVRIAFDFDKVSVLQPNKAELWQYVTQAVGGPWVTIDEARAEAGLEPMPGGKGKLTSTEIAQQNSMDQIAAQPKPAFGGPGGRKLIAAEWVNGNGN